MRKNKLVIPVVKWVGGKRQLLDDLLPLLPKSMVAYCEPFIGGGAMLFKLQKNTVYINDINEELINLYEVIKNDVENLILSLQIHHNEVNYFYKVRDWDRNKTEYDKLTEIQKAARFVFLNKTCYNGLFRVNNSGEFNSPFGSYKNPSIVNEPTLRAVSAYFNNSNIKFSCGDYADALAELPRGAFVYLDPPYDPVSDTANFTGYARGGFTRDDQIRLRESCDVLNQRGIKFMLSNSSTDFIRQEYKAYNITTVKAKRAINSDATKRGQVDEVVVRNYE